MQACVLCTNMFFYISPQNKFLFGWLSHLVEQGLMDEIEVAFLVVGHTHCSIDQYFSTISGYLRKKADFVLTPDAMRYLLTVCHHDESRRPDPRFVISLKVMFE